MGPEDYEPFVRQIHTAGPSVVLAVTGGGSEAISRLLTVPGASRSVLEALVPYADAALTRFLGGKPDQACSAVTARAMAMAAYRRAEQYAPGRTDLAGVACTASLASDHLKRGPHRLHAAYQTRTATTAVWLEFSKLERSRAAEERLAGDLLLNLVAEACGVADRVPIDLLAGEQIERVSKTAPDDWQLLLAGGLERTAGHGGAESAASVVLPGAFNPLHDGHRQMAAVAQRLIGQPVAFELSIVNVDKPPLDFIEIERRLDQFGQGETVWLTRAATFVEKARLFPGATFAVGVDTLVRIADPHYYGGSPAALEHAIRAIAAQDCRFLVFGRIAGGVFRTMGELPLPLTLARLCTPVAEGEFRVDLSSTELRTQPR